MKVLRLDTGGDFQPHSTPLAVYFMLEETAGLLITFGSHQETTTISYMTLEDIQEEHGTEWGESSLRELEQSDGLNQLVGKAIKAIKIGQFSNDEKFIGDDFVVKGNQYAGVVLQTISDSVVFYSTKEGGQILFDKDELPWAKKSWTLQ